MIVTKTSLPILAGDCYTWYQYRFVFGYSVKMKRIIVLLALVYVATARNINWQGKTKALSHSNSTYCMACSHRAT